MSEPDLPLAPRLPAGWTFRAARPDDAAACAPLILASGVGEFGFFLGAPPEAMVAFLRRGFASRHGRFSWRRHRVAVAPDGSVAGVLAAHDGRVITLDDPHVAWLLLRVFGLRHTLAALLRGLVLEGELPAPKRTQTHLAHCAIDERWRGTGVFTALFDDACRHGVIATDDGREVVLDVLQSNPRAAALYRRLGFVALPRAKPPAPKLPRELVSIRMRWQRGA